MSLNILYINIAVILVFLQTGCNDLNKDYIVFNRKSNKPLFIKFFDNVRFEYKIMNRDRVSIIVYKHPDLSTRTELQTAEDIGIPINKGKISLPLIGDVKIVGLTEKEASDKIEKLYGKFLKYSKVRLEVTTKRVYIMGDIKNPGEFDLGVSSLTLLELIIKAGDFTETANKKKVMIIRPQKKNIKTVMLDLSMRNSLFFANKLVRPNDIIYVLPKDSKVINSSIQAISPIFSLISNLFSPFITYRALVK